MKVNSNVKKICEDLEVEDAAFSISIGETKVPTNISLSSA